MAGSNNSNSSVFMDVLMDEHAIDEAVARFMRELIKERLTTKMLEIVDELQHLFNHDARHGSAFPLRAGNLYEFNFEKCFASTTGSNFGFKSSIIIARLSHYSFVFDI